jgi:hypothetical protein
MNREFVVLTPRVSEFRDRIKALLYECRRLECFSVLLTPLTDNDFCLFIQTNAAKKGVRVKFSVQEHGSFVFSEVKKIVQTSERRQRIGSFRTLEYGVKSVHDYLHLVLGGVFCKKHQLEEIEKIPVPLLNNLLEAEIPVVEPSAIVKAESPSIILPPYLQLELPGRQKNGTEESE